VDALSGRLGLQVLGANTTLTGDLPDEGQWRGSWGLGGGLLAELDLAADVSISLQPSYTPRVSRQEFEDKGEVVDTIDYEIEYLTLPLVVRVTGDPVGVRGFVTAGLELNLLLGAHQDDGDGSRDLTEALDPTSFGALFGAGVMIPAGRHFLLLEVRYVQGLEDIVDRRGTGVPSGLTSPSVKYRGLEVLAGFAFTLGGD
jgi:hypothetical protein